MSDEIVFDVLCTKVLDALRALGLGKFSIRNYYYEGMWPIIKVYRSEGVILYSAAFTNEIVDRFRLEHENGLVADRIWAKVRKAAVLFEEYVQTGKIVWKRVRPAPKIPLTPYYQELLCSFCQHEANTRAIGFESLRDEENVCRKFFAYLDASGYHTCQDINLVNVNDFLLFIRKTPGTVVEFLTVPALETLFEQPNRFKTNGYRDFCFMRLMYDTAARCQELVDAKIHDLSIRKTHATICLAGKGNKLRIVPISPSVVELLKTYLDKAHPTEQRQSDDYLFFTTHHGCKNRMSTDAVNLFMKKYGETARRACPEVPERVHPHQLRHSRAMHLYRAGMPLVLLSEFLGHADVNTTRIYAWADTEMKRQAIQKVSKATAEDSIEPIWANDEEMIKRLYGLA